MDTTTKARTLLDNHSRLKNKVILLDITIVTPCDGPSLENEARVGKHFADAVERKKNKNWGWYPATYSLVRLAMSTCGEAGSDVHALIKEPAIRRVEHRSEKHSKESQQLAEGTEVAHLRQQFSIYLTADPSISYAPPSLQTGGGACEHPAAPFARPGVYTRASYRGVTRSEGRERANGVGGGIGVGGGSENDNGAGCEKGDANGDGVGDGAEARTETGTGL